MNKEEFEQKCLIRGLCEDPIKAKQKIAMYEKMIDQTLERRLYEGIFPDWYLDKLYPLAIKKGG